MVSVIIPSRPGDQEVLAVAAAQHLNYPKERLEIILARGTQPAVQRNAAIRAAKGEFIYFLDDDSLADSENLQRALAHFERPEVQMVGGPNLCPPEAPLLEHAFALTMASKLAFGPSRARYLAIGTARPSSEKELILCNLMARKAPLLTMGGFDEALYPNEENALMDDLQAQGGVLMYDPEFIVHRRPRKTVRAFVKMLLNYGRGRAEQFRLHPTPGSALNFVPPLFCLYLLAAMIMRGWTLWPMAVYGIAVAAQALALARHGRAWWMTPLFIFLTHLFYGLGFWRGLFSRPNRGRPASAFPVTLESISLS